MNQQDVFLGGEGDNWFRRVMASTRYSAELSERERLLISSLPDEIKNPRRTFVEVGCSRGDSLQRITSNTGMLGVGIEPSNSAIAAGRSLFPDLDLRSGTAASTGLQAQSVDVLYYGWCLTYVETEALPSVIHEVKRVLKVDGMLAIFDFDYVEPHDFSWAYAHLDGVKTYRRNYLALFREEGFETIAKFPLYAEGTCLGFHPDPAQRLTLLVMSLACNFGYPANLV